MLLYIINLQQREHALIYSTEHLQIGISQNLFLEVKIKVSEMIFYLKQKLSVKTDEGNFLNFPQIWTAASRLT